MTPPVRFEELPTSHLVVDRLYEGGLTGNAGDDPFPRLLSVSNMGGFRYRGSLDKLELLVLTTTLSDPDWPDSLDAETGVFTYYGDNKHPGRSLHATPRHGNEILRDMFELAHGGFEQRSRVPPILVFASTRNRRDVKFLGLAVPGTLSLRPSEDLVAVWKLAEGRRFQNYRARFTILDAPLLSRAWIKDIVSGNFVSQHAPAVWTAWITSGHITPLMATRSLQYRRKNEQLPGDPEGKAVIGLIHEHFSQRPHDFEYFAAALAKIMLPEIAAIDVTRPSRDGGRDAVGKMRIGIGPGAILVDFALEAKCYSIDSSVGVRDISRLISRLRHRQFGIMVTTAYVDSQAYRELKEDGHPVIVIAANDILTLLRANGRGDPASVRQWLQTDFPP
jgi:hypothetical protein